MRSANAARDVKEMTSPAPKNTIGWDDLLKTDYPPATQIDDLSRDLLAISSSLTPMAVDHIFYHHFLDDRLQRELRRLRRRHLGTKEPNPHLGLSETAAALQLAGDYLKESTRDLQEQAKRTADRKMMELEAALGEARRDGTPEALERVARLLRRPPKPRRRREEVRLDELARQIPADRLSLTFALLHGTPVLPPGLSPWDVDGEELFFGLDREPSVPAGMACELTEDAGLLFTVYSARIPKLKTVYRRAVEYHHRVVSLGTEPPTYSPGGSVAAAYAEGPGLPRITIETRRAADFAWPLPDVVDGIFRAARQNFAHLLYDGGRKGRDTRFAIRVWTVALLSDLAGMSRREAINLWNERRAPRGLSYKHAPGVASPGEIRFQQDYVRLRQRIERMRNASDKVST